MNKSQKIKHLFLLSAVYCLLSTLFGCGYTTRSSVYPHPKKLYVEPFVNKIDLTAETSEYRYLRTYYPLLEAKITRKVVDRYIFDGNLKISKREDAELILKGNLLEYRRDPLRYDDDNNVTEYRISLVVDISLWDNKEDKLIWQESNFVGDTTYTTTGALAKSEDTAINNALTDLARRVVERTVEAW